jgi:hypothetical protein
VTRADTHHERLTSSEAAVLPADRAVGFAVGAAGVVVGLAPLLHGRHVRPWVLAGAAAFLLLAIVRPRWLHPVNRAWMAFGAMASAVMTALLMVLVFYGVVVPVGWLMRRLGHDPLRLQRDAKARTYWITRDPTAADSMKNQF